MSANRKDRENDLGRPAAARSCSAGRVGSSAGRFCRSFGSEGALPPPAFPRRHRNWRERTSSGGGHVRRPTDHVAAESFGRVLGGPAAWTDRNDARRLGLRNPSSAAVGVAVGAAAAADAPSAGGRSLDRPAGRPARRRSGVGEELGPSARRRLEGTAFGRAAGGRSPAAPLGGRSGSAETVAVGRKAASPFARNARPFRADGDAGGHALPRAADDRRHCPDASTWPRPTRCACFASSAA